MKKLAVLLILILPVILFGLNGLSYNSYALLSVDNGFVNNPCGLNAINTRAFFFMFNNVGDSFYNMNLAYGQRFSKIVLGAGFNYKTSGELDVLNASGEAEGSFKYNLLKFNIMASTPMFFIDMPDLFLGLRIKAENEQAKDYSDTAYMADVSALFNIYFYKSKYIDKTALFVSLENAGKNLADVNRMRVLGGILAFIPLAKDLSQILFGVSVNQYLDSQLKDNSGVTLSLGYKETLSLISRLLKGYNFMVNLSYNYSDAYRTIGDVTGLEYGLGLDSKGFSFGYNCLFNRLTGNNYYVNLSIKM